MRARLVCLAVLLFGLTMIGAALEGMRGIDTSLKAAASPPTPQVIREQTWQAPPHDCDGEHGEV